MEGVSALIQAVESFEGEQDSWSENLERFIAHVARTGDILAPWEKVQKVFMNKMQLVLDDFFTASPYQIGKVNANAINDDFDEMKKRLLQLAEEFESPPFTIQRLCELLANPRKNYTKCDKFMRGLEKNLMVVSSWNNTPRRPTDGNDSMMNGVGPSNGFITNDRLKPHWANLPPSPIATGPPRIPGAPDFTEGFQQKKESVSDDVETKEGERFDPSPDTNAASESMKDGEAVKQPEMEDALKKPNVSVTIISSSPPKTINVKRKIDESSDEASVDDERRNLVAESPTKKLKFDLSEQDEGSEVTEGERSLEEKKTAQSPKNEKIDAETAKREVPTSGDDSAKSENSAESLLQSATQEEETPETDTQMESGVDSSQKEGTSVDPPLETEESKMEVD